MIPGSNLDPLRNEDSSTRKRNRPLIPSTWMNPNCHLSERRQTQKAACHVIPFIQNLRKGKTVMTESRSVVAKGWHGTRKLTTREY